MKIAYHPHKVPTQLTTSLPISSYPSFPTTFLHTTSTPTRPRQHSTMAAAASASSALLSFTSTASNRPTPTPSIISFQGLKPVTSPRSKTTSLALPVPRRSRPATVRSELSAPLVITLSTGLSLFLGRFVFFNFQRENVAKQVPEQNGKTHFEAGDVRAQEYVSLLKSNDPVGFNIVDVLAWGSIGHIVAYYILATSSNGYDPKFFG